MTFEEWDTRTAKNPTMLAAKAVRCVIADWKAEREKLIRALKRLIVFEDDHDAAGTEWHDAQKAAVEKARAILQEEEG